MEVTNMKSTWISTDWATNVATNGTFEHVETLMINYALSVPILRIIANRKDLDRTTRKIALKYIQEYAASLEKEVA
jgi:hypothetical protein